MVVSLGLGLVADAKPTKFSYLVDIKFVHFSLAPDPQCESVLSPSRRGRSVYQDGGIAVRVIRERGSRWA